MMKKFTKIALVSSMAISANAMAMQAMDDAALSASTGQDGINIGIGISKVTIDKLYIHDNDGLAAKGTAGTDAGSGGTGTAGAIVIQGTTDAANLAKAYAGICYFKLGDTKKALDLLKSYDGSDKMIAPSVTGLIGDCLVNEGKVKDGIGYFEKAASQADNEVISPVYLKKAGLAYESLNQPKDAVKAYTTIKEKYFNSLEAADIDKYIARASAK